MLARRVRACAAQRALLDCSVTASGTAAAAVQPGRPAGRTSGTRKLPRDEQAGQAGCRPLRRAAGHAPAARLSGRAARAGQRGGPARAAQRRHAGAGAGLGQWRRGRAGRRGAAARRADAGGLRHGQVRPRAGGGAAHDASALLTWPCRVATGRSTCAHGELQLHAGPADSATRRACWVGLHACLSAWRPGLLVLSLIWGILGRQTLYGGRPWRAAPQAPHGRLAQTAGATHAAPGARLAQERPLGCLLTTGAGRAGGARRRRWRCRRRSWTCWPTCAATCRTSASRPSTSPTGAWSRRSRSCRQAPGRSAPRGVARRAARPSPLQHVCFCTQHPDRRTAGVAVGARALRCAPRGRPAARRRGRPSARTAAHALAPTPAVR